MYSSVRNKIPLVSGKKKKESEWGGGTKPDFSFWLEVTHCPEICEQLESRNL